MNHKALWQLATVRVKQFLREPEAIFWTYGFPLIMVVVLGLAFRDKPDDVITFDVIEGDGAASVLSTFEDDKRFTCTARSHDEALDRLRRNRVAFVIEPTDAAYVYHYDATNPEGRSSRAAVDDALQRAAGRQDPVATSNAEATAPGSRYIDFLVPGLIGMNLMGGGLWGIGFSLVDLRVRKLLKRLLATPMRRSEFLLSMVGVRALFFIPEMGFLLAVAFLVFKIPIRGSLLSVAFLGLVGSLSFAGLGLLTACRAKRLETVSGLMNLVMMPMWLMSGIFFSYERFPEFLQPIIKALPLTQLIDALRAIILEGATLTSQLIPMLILALWGGVSFMLALRWFRWND